MSWPFLGLCICVCFDKVALVAGRCSALFVASATVCLCIVGCSSYVCSMLPAAIAAHSCFSPRTRNDGTHSSVFVMPLAGLAAWFVMALAGLAACRDVGRLCYSDSCLHVAHAWHWLGTYFTLRLVVDACFRGELDADLAFFGGGLDAALAYFGGGLDAALAYFDKLKPKKLDERLARLHRPAWCIS